MAIMIIRDGAEGGEAGVAANHCYHNLNLNSIGLMKEGRKIPSKGGNMQRDEKKDK